MALKEVTAEEDVVNFLQAAFRRGAASRNLVAETSKWASLAQAVLLVRPSSGSQGNDSLESDTRLLSLAFEHYTAFMDSRGVYARESLESP